jgi:hypothetical protein
MDHRAWDLGLGGLEWVSIQPSHQQQPYTHQLKTSKALIWEVLKVRQFF